MRTAAAGSFCILVGSLICGVMLLTAGTPVNGKKPTAGASPSAEEKILTPNGELNIDAAVLYFENLYRSDSSHSRAELVVIKPRRSRRLRMELWTKGEEKALIVIEDPAREKGTATLKVDKNLWNYLPRIKRTIRIPPSMMLGSWMGSDFTNDDLVRESSFREDYAYKLAGSSKEPPGWTILFEAKPGVVGLWQKFELTVSEDGKVPLKARYFDRKGRLARTMTWDTVKDFDGKRIPAHMTLVPVDKEGYRTEMTYLEMEFNKSIPDSTFSLSELERKR